MDLRRQEELLRVSYQLCASTQAWAQALHAVAGPALAGEHGSVMALLDLSKQGCRVLYAESDHRVLTGLVHLGVRLMGRRIRDTMLHSHPFGASSEFFGAEFPRLASVAKRLGARDSYGFGVTDSVDFGLMVSSATAQVAQLDKETVQLWNRHCKHVSAGLRLQRVEETTSLDAASIEALFEGDGRVASLRGMARMPAARDELQLAVREAVHSSDGAWDAIVSGRWSLIKRVDTDGRRYWVAYRNPAGVCDPRRLLPREREIASRAALGASNKEIAIDLGVGESSVGTQLRSALLKLGLRRRTDLPVFWADFHGRAQYISDPTTGVVTWRPGLVEAGPLDELAPGEREVAELVIEGLTNSAIAKRRSVSVRTIGNQLSVIYRKLSVHSRSELVALATQAPPQSTRGFTELSGARPYSDPSLSDADFADEAPQLESA